MLILSTSTFAQLPREQWGAPAVVVSQADGKWIIKGRRNTVTLNESDLALKVEAGASVWEMAPSSASDMLVRSKGADSYVRLADAQRQTIARYDTGSKTV
jgi:hypothetical protein